MENIKENTNKSLTKQKDLGNFQFLLNQKENVEKIEKEHRDVIKFITDANKNESKEIFVPVCDNFAYFVGKIKNPKECKVYLGEDYFLKTSSDKAIRILTNRVDKTKEILDNLNKEISTEKKLIDKQGTTTENSKNLKQLHDNTFEIVEDVSEKELQNLKNKSVKIKISDEQERERMMKEKLEKMKEFKTNKESPTVLSAVKKKTCQSSSNPNNLKDIESNSIDTSKLINNSSTTSLNTKKKDIIDSNLIPKEIEKIENNIDIAEEKSRRSYFYNEDENE